VCVKVIASQRWDVFLRHGVQCTVVLKFHAGFADGKGVIPVNCQYFISTGSTEVGLHVSVDKS